MAYHWKSKLTPQPLALTVKNLMKSIELQHMVKTDFHVAQNSDISEQLCGRILYGQPVFENLAC